MKALVTGASGFIGSHLVEQLVARGVVVRALVRTDGKPRPDGGPSIESLTGDLRDPEAVRRAVAGCDVVYHLAAKTSRTDVDPQTFFAINRDGTENVVRAALASRVSRLVYCSTCGIYGIPRIIPGTEDTAAAPNTPYRRSKWEGEQIVRRAGLEHGLPVVIARPGSVSGPRGLNWLGLCRAIVTGQFRMINPGRHRLSLTDAGDAVDGLIRCGETPGVEGETFNLVGRETILVADMIRGIARRVNATLAWPPSPAWYFKLYFRFDELLYRTLRVSLPRAQAYEMYLVNRVFSSARAEARLGYRPRITAEESLDRTVNWYRSEGLIPA